MNRNQTRRDSTFAKEMLAIEKQERKMGRAALNAKPAVWKHELESRIPEKVYAGLESAFCKGFRLVFDHGRPIIEKCYSRESLQKNHAIRDFSLQLKGSRRELNKMRKHSSQSNFLNLAVTTVEGIGLGFLGVGMPDIVLFLATLLKGIYETALNYGFDYETRQEQLFILKMMETALTAGEDWAAKNAEVDEMLSMETVGITDAYFRQQIKETASVFAMDMLLIKFIQGIPVVGMLGGAANPVYYRKIMGYVQLKYRKRYLLKQICPQTEA